MPSPAQRPRVEIHTDGGADPNPGPGGWGAVLRSRGHLIELSGYEPHTTNNRMELTAAIEALRSLNTPCEVDLYTDSQYLRRGITEWISGWQKRNWIRANGSPVVNVDLWKALDAQTQQHTVRWHWVKGHRGNRWNERADRLATQARRSRTTRRKETTREKAPSTVDRGQPANERPPAEEPLPSYAIYSRACALGTPGPAGYAALVIDDEGRVIERTGAWPLATNNEVELWAVIAGLQALPEPARVTVHTPSQYVLGGATRWLAGWERNSWRTAAGKPVKNRELWRELIQVMGDHDMQWEYLGADAPGDWSDRAAALAREQAEKQRESQPNK